MTQRSMNVIACDGCDATVARKKRIDARWLNGVNHEGYTTHHCPACRRAGRCDVVLSSRLQAMPARYAGGRAG